MNNHLDIITITKDDLDGISNTIKSTEILRTIHGVRQIIVDSSNLDVQEKIKEVLVHEKNIEYVWQKPAGIASAFNTGLDLSQSEWVWFLNGGDQAHPALEPDKLLYILEQSKAEAIIFEFEFMQSLTKYKIPPLWAVWPPVFYWIPHPSTIIRRDLFKRFGQFKEKYKIAMDGEIWFRFFSKNVIVNMLSIPIALYDESGISSTQEKKKAREGEQIIRANIWMLVRIWLVNGIKIFAAWLYYLKTSLFK